MNTPQLVTWEGKDRRVRNNIERRDAWRCLKCGDHRSRVIGTASLGAQIRKCGACNMMDRRRPFERRRIWPTVAPATFGWELKIATVLAALLALAGALIGSGLIRP